MVKKGLPTDVGWYGSMHTHAMEIIGCDKGFRLNSTFGCDGNNFIIINIFLSLIYIVNSCC